MEKRTRIGRCIYLLALLMAFVMGAKGSYAQAKAKTTKTTAFGTPKQLRARSYEENRICLK